VIRNNVFLCSFSPKLYCDVFNDSVVFLGVLIRRLNPGFPVGQYFCLAPKGASGHTDLGLRPGRIFSPRSFLEVFLREASSLVSRFFPFP